MAKKGEQRGCEGGERKSTENLAGKIVFNLESTYDSDSFARMLITLSYVTSLPNAMACISGIYNVNVLIFLPNRSMTAPTLELKSSFISLRQLHKTIRTRSKESGICSTRCDATGNRHEAATARTSSSRSPNLINAR